ncbi:MAG: hypothetical protein Q8K67_13200 [Geothrix sp.]|nr:hypothetical protein [Geothrix sp.]
MPLYRASLQTLGAIALLAVTLACGGSTTTTPAVSTAANIYGTVTYQRVPLAKDANGVPTGLADASVATNLQSLPARGVFVRAYQKVEQIQPDGTKILVWILMQSSQTDSLGVYSLTVAKDRPTMVEVLSSFLGGFGTIHVIAEPAGINSPTEALNRLQYGLRKAADGSAPVNVNAPSSMLSADATVNFSVGLNDAWWVTNPSYRISSQEAPLVDQAVLETSLPGRTPGFGSGSRILGIGDTIATFVTTYGSATPGTTLDLHYWPGRSEPRGSYVEYDRSLFPQAFDSSLGTFRYFGSLRGGPTNDDAWDEGVILPLLARNLLFAGNANRTYSVPLSPLFPPGAALTDFSPDMARIEGLADAMAANVLESPYLADTQGTALAAPLLDIRDISGLTAPQLTPHSAPALRALSWEIILKANSLPTPGAATDWANINPAATVRYFFPPAPVVVGTELIARDIEPFNIYNQLNRLKEVKGLLEPVDLAAVFTDAVLTPLTLPFDIPWPRPTAGTYASFVADWGTDPTGALPPAPFSMAKASLVNGSYPNVSQGEVFYAGFSLNADKRCVLNLTISPALAAGGQVDVDLSGMARTFTFTGSGGSTETIVIPVYTTAPIYHPVRLRLKSPSVLQPDVLVTLTLVPAP